MKQDIVVIGGYGHVGGDISKQLGAKFPGKVYAAGRSLERAKQFADQTGGQVKPMAFNLTNWKQEMDFERVKLIVMCMDQTDDAFVQASLRSGTHYVDISAYGPFLTSVEKHTEEAAQAQATAVLSVGLAPGVTNLLARKAQQELDQLDSVDIAIMLGLGDQHGKAAIEWTVDSIGSAFSIVENGGSTQTVSFSGGKRTDFGKELGSRMAYRFPFSDQQSLPRTLKVPTVSTRLCFDSGAVTRLVAWIRATGLFRLLKVKWIRSAAVSSFGMMRFGSDGYAVKVDGWGMKAGKKKHVQYLVDGSHEAAATAKVATAVAAAVYEGGLPGGVFHTEQLFELVKSGKGKIALQAAAGITKRPQIIEGLRYDSWE
ncbi:saccharopine dehydrogenase [Paenibacillus sp. BIHB 4019]|uniref:Saccharopine dehydrogenase n=1 Tax=Paenibacillus sp. BIHB 4019 TaxID=1870819 RepID=A0A1B2DPX5_9BACL|nr:saccharopine dehydrogenase NADP-binding domain-containing protein [Paenibacillus sp. BIHB 4019]ANY69749.1 saccharopine dehydrogenase [Paenibacillus sp. BIHB 4019]